MSNVAPPDDLVDDETLMTEITIQPDGRLFVFGTSREVLEVLDLLRPGDEHVAQLLGRNGEIDLMKATTLTTHSHAS